MASKTAERVLLVVVLGLCAIGNLPWHLDNYDQAKQAYVPYEIANGGDWWYQHTPHGKTATKPPLAGWLSLPFYWTTGSWDLAWRLPGYLCTLAMLWLLAREARRVLPDCGTLLVICAFGLNLLTPRISTLVRTDMMLTLWITVCGWLIYRKIDSGQPWTRSEKWAFFLAMLAALLTKGPILYAFILPGMAAFWFLGPKDRRSLVWSGWWTWLLPLAAFITWLVIGCATNPEFYNDVVIREFMSRFDQSLKGARKTAADLVLFPSSAAQICPVEPARSCPADHLAKCSPPNQIRPWDSLACVLGGWGIALHDICALQACGPNFPGNSPAMPAPGLHGISLPVRQTCSCLVWCGRRRRHPGGLRLFSHHRLDGLPQPR